MSTITAVSPVFGGGVEYAFNNNWSAPKASTRQWVFAQIAISGGRHSELGTESKPRRTGRHGMGIITNLVAVLQQPVITKF